MPLRRIRNQIRKGLALAKKTKSRLRDVIPERETQNLTPTSISVEKENISKNNDWSKQTSFHRSQLTLQGSSVIKIWFETVDEIGIRFSLDLETGLMFECENWSPDIQMPGADYADPEPLSVWGIDSQDGSVNIIMHVGEFDSLYIDGKQVSKEGNKEVNTLLKEITNIVVRDLWVSTESDQDAT